MPQITHYVNILQALERGNNYLHNNRLRHLHKSRIRVILFGQRLSPFLSSAFNDVAPGLGLRARHKSVLFFSLFLFWLIRSFWHNIENWKLYSFAIQNT